MSAISLHIEYPRSYFDTFLRQTSHIHRECGHIDWTMANPKFMIKLFMKVDMNSYLVSLTGQTCYFSYSHL